MQFLYWPLTWGFLLVLVPLLIHLINLMRQRRIEWAAMDFLLAAYKKQRKWIWLKQLLLLLTRMLAIALVVAMLARLVTQQQWLSRFGSKPVHHLVLLDDSLSMSDREAAASAFDRATQAIGRLTTHLSQQAGTHGSGARFSVIRFSQAARGAPPLDGELAADTTQPSGAATTSEAAPPENLSPVLEAEAREADAGAELASAPIADLNMAPVDQGLPLLWENKRVALQVSQLAVDPQQALEMAARVAQQRPDDRLVVYLFSDFRKSAWSNPAELKTHIAQLEEQGAQVNLVRCVETVRPNLAITSLQPAPGTLAAGVPLFVDLTVRNFGEQPAEHVVVSFHSVFHDDRMLDGSDSGPAVGASKADREELPGLEIERIGPGESVQRRVQVYFPIAGNHVVEASLPADAVQADNHRWCVIPLPPEVPVLIVDDDPTQRNAAYLTSVFNPGKLVETGIRPDVQPASFLRDTSSEALSSYRAVYLLDVASLDDRALDNLERYVAGGGGLAVFVGPQSSRDFLQRWHDDGNGLFPVPVDRMDLLDPSPDGSPDLNVEEHRLFQVLAGERNRFLRSILVRQYYRTQRGWTPPSDAHTRVLARLRNDQPFVVERTFGDGRVVTVLSTLTPTWNNWATGPTFVVFILELQAYINAPDQRPTDRMVGAPIMVQLDAARYLPEVAFAVPSGDSVAGAGQPASHDIVRTVAQRPAEDAESPILSTQLGAPSGGISLSTGTSGIYEAWLREIEGDYAVQRYALNVDTRESDLELSLPEQVADSVGDQVAMLTVDDVTSGAPDDRRLSLSQFLMFALVGLLIGEQLLAYSASYHPAARSGR